MDAFDRTAGRPEYCFQRQLCRQLQPSAAGSDRTERRRSVTVPEPEPAKRGATRNTYLWTWRRGYGLLPDRRGAGEWDTRTPRFELRQQCLAIHDWPCELQRARAERPSPERTAGILRLLYL